MRLGALARRRDPFPILQWRVLVSTYPLSNYSQACGCERALGECSRSPETTNQSFHPSSHYRKEKWVLDICVAFDLGAFWKQAGIHCTISEDKNLSGIGHTHRAGCMHGAVRYGWEETPLHPGSLWPSEGEEEDHRNFCGSPGLGNIKVSKRTEVSECPW